MDLEGVDVALIFPATFSTASTMLDVEMQNELYAAYHRYLDAYCGEHPDRLKAAALMNARDPQWSAAELRALADKPWLAAVEVLLPENMPIDDPALAPIFEAMDDCDVPFVHHSFFYEPPYFPGYARHLGQPGDRPDGVASVGRATIARVRHPERNVRPLLDAADRVRRVLRAAGSAAWLNRMTYQADYLAARLPEIKRTPIEYALDGRIFCGVELDEGPDVVQGVAAVVGDGVLMYSSDYPHGGLAGSRRRSTSRWRGASSSAKTPSPSSPTRTPGDS